MKAILKKMISVLFLLPFVIGSAGYILSGNSITDALYASFALYFINPVSDGYNIWIEIARWTAPLVTATAVLCVFENAWKNILRRFYSLSDDSVAVYADSDMRIVFDKRTKAFYAGRKVQPAAKSHMILLDSDEASFQFYEDNKHKLAGRSVYIGLREIEYGLIRGRAEVNFFDINGTISRLLWKQAALWKKQKEEMSVVIWGKGYLAENILCHGLLLNLYSEKQRITYHMIGNDLFKIRHPQLPLMNSDEIVFHSREDSDSWEIIRRADIIIIAGDISAAMLQALVVNGKNAQIYYYSRKSGDVGDCLQMANLIPFGRDADIYTDENIRQEKLVDEAKKLNLEYAGKYSGETDWNKLSGFLKWSNISSADFGHVLEELLEDDPERDDEELAELEHIRWCRLYYLNYWTLGEPADGSDKDSDRKIHKCLRPYCELSQENKSKDRTVIEEVRKNRRCNIAQ